MSARISGVKSQGSAFATGPALMVAGMLLIGGIDNFIILIAEKSSLWQFHVMRSMMALTILLLLSAGGKVSLRPRSLRNVLLRSAAMASSMLIYFGCLAFLPIGEVVAGLFTGPIIVLVISATLLGQTVGPVRWFSSALGFAGILIVISPQAGGFSWVSVAPLISALFYAISALLTQHRCRTETTATLLFWFYLVIGLSSAVMLGVLTFLHPVAAGEGAGGFVARGWGAPDVVLMGLVLMQAAGSLIAVGLITKAYQVGEATNVAIFEYSLMIFAPVWALIIWDQPIVPRVMLGAALIIASGAIIALRTRRPAVPNP